MTKYIALLRGINVGGNNKVEMSKLKKSFESLGYEKVSTYINSGNIFFETKEKDRVKLVREIEKVLKKDFKLELRVVIRDSKDINKICKKVSLDWKNDDEERTEVLFLWDEFDNKNTLKLILNNPDVDNLIYIPGAIVWNVKRINYSKSGMRKFIGTKVYKNITGRNINTVRKINGLME